MARRHRLRFVGGIYHVTFKGNGRRDIFHDAQDYERLTARVTESAMIPSLKSNAMNDEKPCESCDTTATQKRYDCKMG